MSYDVVIVGAGIGGLTVAALLSAHGVKTCLLERQSQVGGCIARVEFSGHDFEPGMGLYSSFGPGGVYEKLFAQLPVDAPQVSLLTSPYVVRLHDGTDVRLVEDEIQSSGLAEAKSRASAYTGIDVPCDLYSISGGPASLAERLAESIKLSGGTLRLDSPVLRLSYDDAARATGVDLLSGERVFASKAIVSNLTVWDTYGKLVGLNRTPSEVRKQLNSLQGRGAYVVYASIEESAVTRLPSERIFVASSSDEDDSFREFTFAISSSQRAPAGKRAVTLTSYTDVHSWFAYHTSEEDFEQQDQAALEQFWNSLHTAVPELGSDIEIIETANPRTYYDSTRRKLGMVLGTEPQPTSTSATTFLPNLFMVGDTTTVSPRLDAIVEGAVSLSNQLTR